MTYYDTGGDREVIVLIHGLASNAKAWIKVVPSLSEEYRVIAVNLPKYLDADTLPQISLVHYSDQIREMCAALDIERASVVGHSMGGQVAMWMSIRHPDLVDKLVLLAPAGIETFTMQDYKWFEMLIKPALYTGLSDEAISRNFDINFYSGSLPVDAQFMLDDRMLIKADTALYHRYAEAITSSVFAMLDEPVLDMMADNATPALVLFGDTDRLIPNPILHPSLSVDDMLSVAAHLPNVTVSKVEQAGHFLQWDQPQMTVNAIKFFSH